MTSSYLVQEEDGVSRFTLEDGSGSILLETSDVTGATPGGHFHPIKLFDATDDEDVLLLLVASLN